MQQPILNGILESPLDLNGFGFVNVGGLLGTFQAHSAVLDTLAATSPSFAGIDILQIANPGVDSYLTVGSNGVPSYVATGNTVSSTESTTVDGQVVLFNGTTGKVIRKSTATGIAKLASGVLSVVTAPTGDLVGHEDAQILYNKTLSLGTLVSNLGLNFERPSGAGIISLLPQGGASSINVFLPSTSGTLITSAEVSDGYVPNTRTVNGHALSSNVTVTPTDLGLVIGTNVQAYSANLSHWAVVNASERVTDFLVDPTLANLKFAVTDETTVGWNLLTLADPGVVSFIQLNANNTVTMLTAGGMRGALGLGTAAIKDTGTTNGTIPLLGTGGRLASGMIPLGVQLLDPDSLLGADLDARTLVGDDGGTVRLAWAGETLAITADLAVSGTVALANLASNGFVKTSGGTGALSIDTASYLLASYLDTDGTLAANSDAKVASQKAVKTYVTAHTVTNSAGANVVPKSNGTNLIASSIVDDGTIVSGGHGAAKFSCDPAGPSVTIGDVDGVDTGTKIAIVSDSILLSGSGFSWNGTPFDFSSLATSLITGTTQTTDNAPFRGIGEYVVASVVQGSATALTTATPKTVTSISLTSGDWDVTAIGAINGASTGTEFDVAISANNNSMTGTVLGDSRCQTPTVSLAGADATLMIPSFRVSLASTTTYYLIVQETFTLGSPKAYGRISARRVR